MEIVTISKEDFKKLIEESLVKILKQNSLKEEPKASSKNVLLTPKTPIPAAYFISFFILKPAIL